MKTLEIPIRYCSCGRIMQIEAFRPYIADDRYANYWRLRWECTNCNSKMPIQVKIE